MLWVGLGLPKQERWIHDHREHLRVPVAVGVGAAFGFVSGRQRRAPAWMGRAGLEWLHRLSSTPRRTWRRVFVQAPAFGAAVLLERIGALRYEPCRRRTGYGRGEGQNRTMKCQAS